MSGGQHGPAICAQFLFYRFPTMFLANRFYHFLHIAQLRAMHRATGARVKVNSAGGSSSQYLLRLAGQIVQVEHAGVDVLAAGWLVVRTVRGCSMMGRTMTIMGRHCRRR